MSSLVKSKKLNFKEFNLEWARAGNYSYTIQFRDKNRALEIESYLIGLNYIPQAPGEYFAHWGHGLRKNFNLRVNPKNKFYYRTSKVTSQPCRYKNVYIGEQYFKNFCFKFVIIEKTCH